MSAPTSRNRKTAREKTRRRKYMAKKAATLEDLLSKPARTKDLVINVPAGKGTNELVVTLKAIGSKAYDDLLSSFPPTAEQKKDGAAYDVDSFAPALIAACAVTPALTVEQATQIWTSNEWSRGELTELFLGCIDVNSKGLDVPFSAAG